MCICRLRYGLDFPRHGSKSLILGLDRQTHHDNVSVLGLHVHIFAGLQDVLVRISLLRVASAFLH